MSGTATLLLLLSCCQVLAYDDIEPPQELNITVPTIGEVVVTWKHIIAPQNKSIKYLVNVSTPETTPRRTKTSENTSTLRMVEGLQEGLAVHVAAQIRDPQSDGPTIQSKWISGSLPPYPGVNGTSATNISCQIDLMASKESSLSCKWDPGDKAPADTEYNLYYRYEDVIEKCQDYITEPGGHRRTGCSMVSGVISPNSAKNILIHVNGTSKSLKIKAMEKIFLTSTIETIPPVQNLTINVSGIHWRKPVDSLPGACFRYEVNIWSKDRNETITVRHSGYSSVILQKPSNRQFIRVRAVGKITCWPVNTIYSQWTDIIWIGEDVDRNDTLGIIVSVCLIVTCILIFFLCIRFWRHIFPHIPKPKNDLKEAFQNVQSQALMRCNSWDNEEVISYIEEVVDPDKYKTSSDYGNIGDYSSSGLCKPL